jgi:hypothetical protein
MWSCPECGPKRKARLEIVARRGRPDALMTLTCRPEIGQTPAQRRKIMGHAFPLLIRRMQRYTGKRIPYFVKCEATKRGEPHLHVLLRSDFIPQSVISDWWKELTGWWIVDIRRVDDGKKAARYLSKYLTKDMVKFGNCKRYWLSRDWVLPPEPEEKTKEWNKRVWIYTKDSIDQVVTTMRREGWWPLPGEVEPGVRHIMPPPWDRGRTLPPPYSAR